MTRHTYQTGRADAAPAAAAGAPSLQRALESGRSSAHHSDTVQSQWRSRDGARLARWGRRTPHGRMLLGLLLLAATGHAPRAVAQPERRARKALEGGQYEKVLQLLQYRRSPAAVLLRARAEMALGRYESARKLLTRKRWPRAASREAALLRAELDLTTGRYESARTICAKLVEANPQDWAARALLGRVLLLLGHRPEAEMHFKAVLSGVAGTNTDRSAEDWLAAGRAALGLRRFQAASDAFELATKKEPGFQQAWIEWAELAMKKYKVDWADEFLKKVLQLNPRHPRALADLAWLEWYAPRGRHERGEEQARKALAVNPRQLRALRYLASLRIYDARYGAAEKLLAKALAVNARDLESLALLAAIRLLKDDRSGFETLAKRVQFAGSEASRFYATAARFLVRHHRYALATRLYEKAVRLDPDNAEALADLGVGLLMTAQYDRGWATLKLAWAKDKYNYRTYNLLNLYDTIRARYVWKDAGPLRFLVPRDEWAILSRYVPQVLTKAVRIYERKYGIHPPRPIRVELYDKPEDFQTRTFGEPAGAGIMGVCFGPVITALSPSVGRANWAYVLWHELAHVFHITMTGGRVPRWFTEGLAEYETMVAKPYWKREYAALLHRQILAHELPSVLEINDRFTHSKTILGVVLAYYQSSLFIAYIAKKWGFGALVRALKGFARGMDTRAILTQILRIRPKAFDQGFVSFFYRRFPFLKGQFDPYVYDLFDVQKLKTRADAHPRDATSQIRAACALAEQRGLQAAAPYFGRARALAPTDPRLRFCLAVSGAAGPPPKRYQLLQELVRAGRDCYAVRMEMAKLALRLHRDQEAVRHLRRAAKWNPEAAAPWTALSIIYKKRGKELASAMALYHLAWIEHTSSSVAYTALKLLAHHKRWDLVRKLGPLAIHIQPFNPLIHEKYAWSLRAAGRHRQALFEFESALLAKPDNEVWVLMGKALSLAALGKKREALRVIEEILDRDANFMPAVRLKRRLAPEEEY